MRLCLPVFCYKVRTKCNCVFHYSIKSILFNLKSDKEAKNILQFTQKKSELKSDDDYEGVRINLPAHSLWGRHQNTFILILLQVLSNNPSIHMSDVLLPFKFIRTPLCDLLMLNKQ